MLEEASDMEGVGVIFPVGLPALGRFFEPGSRKPAIRRVLWIYLQ